jgi:FG-GAP repeat
VFGWHTPTSQHRSGATKLGDRVRARRLLAAVAVSATVGGLLTGGAAFASPRPTSSPASHLHSTIPAAAQARVTRALARDGLTQPLPALHATELTAHGGRAGDSFGASVAVWNDTIVIGAPDANSGLGEAYVFRRPSSGWAHVQQVATLVANDGHVDDNFGSGVAVSGATIAVSAPYHAVGSHSSQGAVYVFTRPAAGWSGSPLQAAELTASDGAASDVLGYQGVAVSGNTVVAGAGYHQVGANANQGALYVFVRPPAGWPGTTNETAELTASDGAADDYFGYGEVGISGDTVVASSGYHAVGSNAGQGAAYVFVRPPSGWSSTLPHEAAELIASDGGAGDFLGYKSVAIAGNTVVAGAAYHAVGSTADQGAGYVFVRPPTGWSGLVNQAAELIAKNGTAQSYLGYAGVAVSGAAVAVDAPYLTVGGAVDRGATYLFDEPTGGWTGTVASTMEKTAADGLASDYLGYSSTALSGTTLVVGSDGRQVGTRAGQGAAYIFAPVRPSLSALTQGHRRWRGGTRLFALNPATPPTAGTSFAFALNQAATVTIRFVHHHHGHRSAAGSLTLPAPQGHSRLYFSGRLTATKSLPAGNYTALFSAGNVNGRSTVHTLHFTVLSR